MQLNLSGSQGRLLGGTVLWLCCSLKGFKVLWQKVLKRLKLQSTADCGSFSFRSDLTKSANDASTVRAARPGHHAVPTLPWVLSAQRALPLQDRTWRSSRPATKITEAFNEYKIKCAKLTPLWAKYEWTVSADSFLSIRKVWMLSPNMYEG